MAVRYTVTEDNGTVHTRTSRGHASPQYTHAVVRYPGAGKAGVSYCGRPGLAQSQLSAVLNHRWADTERNRAANRVGQMYPDAKMYPVTAEVL